MRNASAAALHSVIPARYRRYVILLSVLALVAPIAVATAQEQEAEESELRRNAVKMGAQGLVPPDLIENTLPT